MFGFAKFKIFSVVEYSRWAQAIESTFPEHVKLSEADRTNVCYLAFPDSNSGVMGDSQFHFRIRVQPDTSGTVIRFFMLSLNMTKKKNQGN